MAVTTSWFSIATFIHIFKSMSTYGASELIINPDGSIFHLHLHPEQVPETILLVGDPGRVALAGSMLSKCRPLASNREFSSVTGFYQEKEILVLSTGIGTDNMDIVVNELDALVNIDFQTRENKAEKRRLKLIRIGTSGSLQPDIPVGSRVASAWSVGLDGLLKFYKRPSNNPREEFESEINTYLSNIQGFPSVYAASAAEKFHQLFRSGCHWGITVAAHGFYGPQGRNLRSDLAFPELNDRLTRYSNGNYRITNFEMESSALYGLSEILGHEALTICLIIANRARQEYLGDYSGEMKELISYVLDTLTYSG